MSTRPSTRSRSGRARFPTEALSLQLPSLVLTRSGSTGVISAALEAAPRCRHSTVRHLREPRGGCLEGGDDSLRLLEAELVGGRGGDLRRNRADADSPAVSDGDDALDRRPDVVLSRILRLGPGDRDLPGMDDNADGPKATSVETTTWPSSSTTSVSPSRRRWAVPCTRLPPASSATNALAGRAISSSAVPVWTTRPSTRTAIRSARAAVSRKSCVTTIVGKPSSRRRSLSSERTRPRVCGSSAAIGSSSSRTCGWRASALASATRCRSPPES